MNSSASDPVCDPAGGYVDLQVNGYAGVDFNDDTIQIEDVIGACRTLADHGNRSILATIITAPVQTMVTRIERLAAWIDQSPEVARVIAGIHVEGPFISPIDGYVGAHPKSCVKPAGPDDAQRLVDAGNGAVRLLTLAPEMDEDARVTRFLVDRGIHVAAGHSDATIDQLRRSIDGGLSLFTHLGNGCPAQLPRHDNIVQRVLALSDRLAVSLIADGHHVPPFALGNYIDRIPDSNIIIVTDAIMAAGLGPGTYQLSGQNVFVDDDGAAWAESRQHFAGCATPMARMCEILRDGVGASNEQIARWTTTNPARWLGTRNELNCDKHHHDPNPKSG